MTEGVFRNAIIPWPVGQQVHLRHVSSGRIFYFISTYKLPLLQLCSKLLLVNIRPASPLELPSRGDTLFELDPFALSFLHNLLFHSS